jgi:cation:H+ antiporter
VPPWLVFLLSGAAVAAAGVRLARDGDDIADRTGLGGAWVGAILVAAATSLPEVMTDISAIRQGHPSLAVGDLFGSSMFNMVILATADLAVYRTRMLTRVGINQALVGVLAICITALAIAGLVAGPGGSVLSLGWPVIAIAVIYVGGMRIMHLSRPEPPFRGEEEVRQARRTARPLGRAVTGFAAAALVILVAAPFLARSAADIARQLGVSSGFVGLFLLAITTSLPEVAVSIESLRMRSYDLAVGNLLGSNAFNMFALVVLDLVDGPGSLLARSDAALAVGGVFAIILTSLAVLETLNKSERRVWVLEPGPALMLLAYVAGLYLTWRAAG